MNVIKRKVLIVLSVICFFLLGFGLGRLYQRAIDTTKILEWKKNSSVWRDAARECGAVSQRQHQHLMQLFASYKKVTEPIRISKKSVKNPKSLAIGGE